MRKKEKLEGIKYLLGGYYHQDVWEDHKTHTHEEVWLDFSERDKSSVEQLKNDVEEMLTWGSQEIFNFFEEDVSGGLRLDTSEEARAWLEKLYKFLEEHKPEN